MALQTDTSRLFRLYVTHVDGEGHFLKISGQLDQPSSLMIESLFETARGNLESGVGAVPSAAIHEGVICAAKYKDGAYYRAKIINTSSLSSGLVGVHFIDYGNKDIISLSTIRFLEQYDPMFLQLRGQATDYYLSRVMHPSGKWDEPLLLKLQSLLCYAEYPATIEANTRSLPLISLQFKGNDLASHLVANRFGIELPISKQEALVSQLISPDNQGPNWQPTYPAEPVSYSEHVPFLMNQNFPSNPASAMRIQQNVPYISSQASPISQRLMINKVPRTAVNLKVPMRQPQHLTATFPSLSTPPPHNPVNKPSSPKIATPYKSRLLEPEDIPKLQHLTAPFPVLMSTPPPPNAPKKPSSPKKSTTYKSRLLEVGSSHKVFVSFAEEGPELFAVQLVTDARKLQDMMDDINRRPHRSLAEPPMIGTVCLGRMTGDKIICRAIVMNLSGSQCKLFFVDFGDTEMVSYYDIFDIPEEFVKPNVYAMRFCLSGVKNLERSPYLNETFKRLVNGKVLTLKVVTPEGPPLIQYGELYLENNNVLDLLMANMKGKLQFKWMDLMGFGSRKSVMVSYVDSCIKFYAQLSEKIDELNAVMDAVKVHCESSSPPGDLPVGAACCARFPEDNNWYRAHIRSSKGSKVIVAYVDYGNEQEVDVSDLRSITPELLRLPAQAMKCALKGFEKKPSETRTSNQLEMLALEKTLTAHVIGVLSNDTMLVSLVDETANPPLDIAKRMMQLSTPRSNIDTKPTAMPTDAPETFSSPDSEDGKKKPFRREKSFKEERRSQREYNEEFGQRPGSFRGRENKEPFDRAGPNRHSDKFASRQDGRPDKGGERRGGNKSWENNSSAAPTPAPAVGDDEWEESTTPAFQHPPRQNRESRDINRRKPRPDHQDHRQDHQGSRQAYQGARHDYQGSRQDNQGSKQDYHGPRPGWKGRESGVGRRLRQATEGTSSDAQSTHAPFSVQDRLKRENKFNQQNNDWEEEKQDDRNKGRQDRRENRGDRRDNWGDKKENFQKREYRDNNRERGDRTKSRFTPRDRAETSMGSESEKSFRSQDSGGRAGRAPPYKSRSKFTQVQYKELPEPVPLETLFEDPTIETGAQHEVSVTWIISPESFYTQILSLQPKFLEMMHKIPEIYKGVKSYTGMVPVGASVLARYPADGVLYRATVVAVQPFSKFIVRYVDFGNKQLVDAKDIWQLDKQLMDLPKMAVHCSLLGVAPKDGEWKANPEIDLCFNAPRYQCVFQENIEEQWKVYLWINGVNVADTLVEKQLAVMSEHQSSVALKDEAIDLTIIVGQQMLCKVTHVESYEKFCVQLDLDKATLVENAIANFDCSKLTPLAADSLADEVHCTVKHEDKIYRAILKDISDPEKIVAVLPDYGYFITTSLANLMILPTELTVYYYQSLPCGLHNYTEDSKATMTIDEMKQRLIGNKFIIYINYVDGIRLMSTLYDIATGKKIQIFEPDEGSYDEVVPLCSRAVFNYNFGMAYISHAENLNEIYLQKSTDSDLLAQLIDDLFSFYEEGTPEELTTFEPETTCAAKSSDGNWYRATIVTEEETGIKVQFSDYGNSETVPKDNVKKLDKKFFEPCSLALVASLGLVALQDDALPKLLEWTTDKEVQVTLAFGEDGWLASLHLDGIDLSMKLVNDNLATPKVTTTNEEPKDEQVTISEPISLPPGCTQVYISHIDTPGHFWLQMSDKIDKIEEIQADLQANADGYANIENRELGVICAAKYLADDLWYRAEILDADSDITTVRFIDYGNTDVLDNEPGLIKVLPNNLRDTERYAVKSSVNAVPTGTGEWSEPASELFTQLVGDLSAPVDASIILVDVTTYVDIYVNGQNLTDKLVTEGYAAKAEEPECGDMPSCFASHINSPSEFWIQLETAAPELQTMESAMVDAENFPELTVKDEGVICAAKYPEDGAWYRAQVIVDGSEGTEVLFMDYGNASIANELRSLPDELKSKPALSRKCALQKPREIKVWSRKSEVKFNELAAEGATIFKVQFIASGDISIVELYLEGKSVTEELIGLCESQPAIERPTPVGQDLMTNGKICYISSFEEFYVQLDHFAVEIDKIIERLTSATDFEAISDLKVGSICAAFWDEDERWYRAKILEFCEGAYHVLFIDYGNKAKCAEFRQLPEDLASIDPAAKCCRLAGMENSYDIAEQVKKLLDDHAAENCTFQIEFLDTAKEPSLVRLFIEGIDFTRTVMLDKEKAVEPTTRNEANETLTDLDIKIRVDSKNITVIPTPNDEISYEANEVPIDCINNEANEVLSKQLHGGSIDTKIQQEIQSSNNDVCSETFLKKEEILISKGTQQNHLEVSTEEEDILITKERMQEDQDEVSKEELDIILTGEKRQEDHAEISKDEGDIILTKEKAQDDQEITMQKNIFIEEKSQEDLEIFKIEKDILLTYEKSQEDQEISKNEKDIIFTDEKSQEDHLEISNDKEDSLPTVEKSHEDHLEISNKKSQDDQEISKNEKDNIFTDEKSQEDHLEIFNDKEDSLPTVEKSHEDHLEISNKKSQEDQEISKNEKDIIFTDEKSQEDHLEISNDKEDSLPTVEKLHEDHLEISNNPSKINSSDLSLNDSVNSIILHEDQCPQGTSLRNDDQQSEGCPNKTTADTNYTKPAKKGWRRQNAFE